MPNKVKAIAMIAYTELSTDTRVVRAAKSAIEAGYTVDFYTLSEDNVFSIKNVNIIRSKQHQRRGNYFQYILAYLQFFLFCFFNISQNYFKKKYTICHINNMPNFLVFSCIIPKIFGAKLILDIHDLMPEIYSIRNGVNFKINLMRKLLFFEERVSANFCDTIISVTDFMEQRIKSNGIYKKYTTIMNIADINLLNNFEEKRYDTDPVKIVYAGTISDFSYTGIDILIYAVKYLTEKTENFKLFIYGNGLCLNDAITLCKTHNLEKHISFSKRFLILDELLHEYNDALIGIVPTRKDEVSNISVSVKTFEYLAKKLATILPDTLFNKQHFLNCTLLFKAGDPKDLADKLYLLIQDRELLKEYSNRGFEYYLNHPWNKYKKIYIDLLNELANKKGNI